MNCDSARTSPRSIIAFSLLLSALSFMDCAGPKAVATRQQPPGNLRITYYIQADTSSGVNLPSPIKRPDPVYPGLAILAKISGSIVVRIWVDAHGVVQRSLVITSSHPIFNKPAIDAVMKWKFAPLMYGGVGKPFTAIVPFKFILTPDYNWEVQVPH